MLLVLSKILDLLQKAPKFWPSLQAVPGTDSSTPKAVLTTPGATWVTLTMPAESATMLPCVSMAPLGTPA